MNRLSRWWVCFLLLPLWVCGQEVNTKILPNALDTHSDSLLKYSMPDKLRAVFMFDANIDKDTASMDRVIRLSREHGWDEVILAAESHVIDRACLKNPSQLESGIKAYEQIIKKAKTSRYPYLWISLSYRLASLQAKLKQSSQAIVRMEDAIAHEVDFPKEQRWFSAEHSFHLADQYLCVDMYDKAKERYIEVTKSPIVARFTLLSAYNSLGVISIKQNNLARAKQCFRVAYNLNAVRNDDFWDALILTNLARAYVSDRQYRAASLPLTKAKAILLSIQEHEQMPNVLVRHAFLSSKVYIENDLDRALRELTDAAPYVPRTTSFERKSDYYTMLANVLKLSGRYKESAQVYSMAVVYADSNNVQMRELQRTTTEERLKVIAALKDLELREEQERDKYLKWLIMGATFALIVALISLVLWLQLNKRKLELKANQQALELAAAQELTAKKDKSRAVTELKVLINKINEYEQRSLEDKAQITQQGIKGNIKIVDNPILRNVSGPYRSFIERISQAGLVSSSEVAFMQLHFDRVYKELMAQMSKDVPNLTMADVRFLSFLALGMSDTQIMVALAINSSDFDRTRLRLSQKLQHQLRGEPLEVYVAKLNLVQQAV